MVGIDDKRKKLLERIDKKERLFNENEFITGSSLDVVFLLDTTGSMDPYIAEIQGNTLRIIEEVLEFSPRVRMGFVAYKDHGDEGEDEFYLTKVLPPVFDRKEIVRFIRSPDLYIGEGGGGPEAVECALHEAVHLNWSDISPKAIILIGDKPPHGVTDSFKECTTARDYRKEVELLKRKGVKIYPILCNSISETETTFRWMAQETGGRFFYLKEISDISDLLVGICLKETGKLPFFERKLLENKDMTESKRRLLLELKGGQEVSLDR